MPHVSLGVFASWREKGPSFINPTARALFTAIKELQAANGVVLELKRAA